MDHFLSDLTPEQILEVASIWHQGWQDGHSGIVPRELADLRTLDSFTDRLGKEVPNTRVAMIDGSVGGFCIVKDDELYQMYVASFARGSGVANVLMVDAENRLRAAGNDRAWLACAIDNNRAARFYEKSGWHNVRTEDVELDTAAGPFVLKVWRFEKKLP